MKYPIFSCLATNLFFILLFLACGFTFLISCDKQAPLVVDDVALSDEKQGENWMAYGRTHNERRFSPLDQINTSNISRLQVDWYMDLPEDVGLVSTPLVVEGVLYFVGSLNVVRAVNAATGELMVLWCTYEKTRGIFFGR